MRLGSIKTWDEMMERFYAKYYPGKDKVTFQTLQMVRQRSREDLVQFIKRFEDVSLDYYRDHKEKELVEIHGNPVEAEESKGSFHPNTVRTLQKSPKFISLFNQLRFGPKLRKIATKSLMSIAADSGVECFTVKSHASRA